MLSAQALHSLRSLLGKDRVVTDPAELIVYEIDAAQDGGSPDAVVFPSSSEEVGRITVWAAAASVPLIARGAGTGLSGGAVAERGGVIVEFSRMNRISEFDMAGRSAVAEPGVVNQTLDELAKSHGLYYPPDPSSGRAATMGGNVAENAGGPHCFKYGVTTNYITGLDFVLPTGRAAHSGGRALDYPEYDWNSLLTGSEGTLALLTRISVRLIRNPPGVKTLMASFDSVEAAGHAVSEVISAGLVPSTLEMLDSRIARAIEDYAHPGLPADAGAILIAEVDGHPTGLDAQMAEIESILERAGARDLHLARSAEERDRLWFARKSAAGAMARLAPAYLLLDGTVPRSRLAAALEAANSICDRNDLRVGYVFHAGDGNLHPFILMYPDDPEQVSRVHQAGAEFMEAVVGLGGSITGEHGVGIEKRRYLPLMYTPQELSIFRDVKRVFDPGEILNPGKIFPSDLAEPVLSHNGAALPDEPFLPDSVEKAAKGLAALSRTGRSIRISGALPGEPQSLEAGPLLLHTNRLNGVRTYAPDDLYVTAGAGTCLADLQVFLSQQGRQVAAASPWAEVTLGGLLAANINAPLRMRYGSLRDQVLAMTVVLADGRTINAGRPVVKNVAGYDLPRFMVGTQGTLGLIAEVTLKVIPQPRRTRTLLTACGTLERALALGSQTLSIALVASAVLVCHGIGLSEIESMNEGPWLVYTAEGLTEDVESELAEVRHILHIAGAPQPLEVEDLSGTELWRRILGISFPQSIKVRLGVAPKDLPSVLSTIITDPAAPLSNNPYLIDLASGLVYASFSTEEDEACIGDAQAWVSGLRVPALAAGGYAVVLETPPGWEPKFNLWGYKPDTLELMQALKARWDPRGILNPGGFILD